MAVPEVLVVTWVAETVEDLTMVEAVEDLIVVEAVEDSIMVEPMEGLTTVAPMAVVPRHPLLFHNPISSINLETITQ